MEGVKKRGISGNVEVRRVLSYHSVVFAFFYWFVLQDFVLGIFYHVTGAKLLTEVLFYTKDVFLLLFFAVALFREKIPSKWALWLAAWFAFLLVYLCLGYLKGVGLFTLAGSLRNLLYLPCLVTIGYGVKKETDIRKSLDRFMRFLLVVGAFGILDILLDMLVGTKNFWRNFVGLTDFLSDIKRQGGDFIYEGLPGNFYGDYSGVFFSQKRLVSFFANPLTSGYVLVIPYFYYLLHALDRTRDKRERRRSLLACIFMGIVVTLTFTRAIILPAAALTFLLLFLKRPRWRIALSALAVAALILVCILFYDRLMIYLFGGSTGAHYNAVAESLTTLDLLGQGIGIYGAHAQIGTESSYIDLLGQMGLAGLVLYIIGSVYVAKRAYRSRRFGDADLATVILLLTLVYAITGLVSEQLFAFTTIAPYYLISGMLMRRNFVGQSKTK